MDDSSKVGSFPAGASPYGVMDIAGNVWEWVADWYAPDYYSTYDPNSWPDNPIGPTGGTGIKVTRGSSWFSGWCGVRAANRGEDNPSYRADNYGFRCARSP